MANKYDRLKSGVGQPCIYCKRRMIKAGSDAAFEEPGLVVSIEHKKYPKSKGGTNEPFNLANACTRCNNLRGNLAEEFFDIFARVVIQQFPDVPTPVLREALRNYVYHLAELSLGNNSGIRSAAVATFLETQSQVKKRDL